MVEVFLQSVLIGYSGAVMPGSLLTYTLEKSIKSGVKAGVMISIGHSLLELLLVVLIFSGLGRYLGSRPVQMVIGILGGLVLIFFGLTMVRDVFTGKISVSFSGGRDEKFGSVILGGAVVSASNPYFIVWWTAIGLGLIMNAYNTFGLLGIILFYLGHITADISWYVGISAIIGKSRKFMNLRIYKVVIAVLGFCLVGFGASFLISTVRII